MGLKLTFKTVQGSTFPLELPDDTKVSDVKKHIEESQGAAFPAQSLVVIASGKILKDDTTLADNNVTENGFLVVMVQKAKPKKEESVPPASTAAPTVVASEPLPSAPAAAAPGVPAAAGGTSELLVGGELEVKINQIMEMGFARDDVVAAMRAAFNNSERAVEYLMTGLPEGVGTSAAPGNAQPPAAVPTTAGPASVAQLPGSQPPVAGPNAQPLDMFAPQAAAPQGVVNAGPPGSLDFLRGSPQFQTLRQIVQASPAILQPMLQELGKQNPQLLQMINDNQQEFLRLINEPAPQGQGAMAADLASQLAAAVQPEGVRIELTEEEQMAVARLEQLGFDRMACLEAYLACDKNEEMAANYLFENANDA